jgi:hypothetical protein
LLKQIISNETLFKNPLIYKNMTIFNILSYLNYFEELEILIQFCIKNDKFIPPLMDDYGNTVFDIVYNNKSVLLNLMKYYS